MPGRITVVGLGPGAVEHITLGAVRAMQEASVVLVRTVAHPAVAGLAELGVTAEALDRIYEEGRTHAEVYARLAEEVVVRARTGEHVVYAVPGHPRVGEESVRKLLSRAADEKILLTLLPGLSALDVILARVGEDALAGLQLLDAQALPPRLDPRTPAVIFQVESRARASELKLSLLEHYPTSHPVTLLSRVGGPAEEARNLPLAELDRGEWFDHLTSVWVPAVPEAERAPEFDDLVEIMARLRRPPGCPWDREQDHRSLRRCLLEECYEVLEAIDRDDPEALCQELGDLLLQVLFHAQLGREAGRFNLADVIRALRDKLVARHPHVFRLRGRRSPASADEGVGDKEIRTAAAVVEEWEAIKGRQVGREGPGFEEVPPTLPALMRAQALQRRAARAGFDWPGLQGPLDKLAEETAELQEAIRRDEGMAEEVGDALFALAKVANALGVEAEQALREASDRFVARFAAMAEAAGRTGRSLPQMDIEEMLRFWEKTG